MTAGDPAHRRTPLIVAHRGLHQRYPENSLPAFEAAWDAGIHWCECDVRMTGCGMAVVFHDEVLDRITTLSGRVDQYSWQHMAGTWLRLEDGTITEYTICVLESVCARVGTATASGGRRRLLVEIKAPCSRQMIADVVGHCCCGIEDEIDSAPVSNIEQELPVIAIQSFDPGVLLHTRRLHRRVPTYLLMESTERLDSHLEAPWNGINFQYDLLTPQLVEHVQGRRKRIGVWTPNTEADLRRAIHLGVDTVITDEPLLAVELLKERSATNPAAE